MLTCKKCSIQYVGETGQAFNVRNNAHRSGTVSSERHTGCPIIHEHFTEGKCKGEEYWCHIIEKMPDTGTDKQQKDKRKVREDFWIRELRTVYPYGLNSRLDSMDYNRRTNVEISFNRQNRYSTRKRGTKRGRGTTWSTEEVIKEIKALSCNNLKYLPRYCCTVLPQIPSKLLKEIYHNILDSQVVPINIKDLMTHMILKYVLDNSQVLIKSERPLLKMQFVNKGIELLGLGKMLNDRDISDCCPSDRPMIVFSYTKPVRNEILNCRQTVQESNFESWQASEGTCDCHQSNFRDSNHNHVLTGNLEIISNFKLKKLFSKGPGYREPRTLNFDLVKETVKTAGKNFIDFQREKLSLPVEAFSEWKCRLFEKIDSKVQLLRNRYRFNRRIKSIFITICSVL